MSDRNDMTVPRALTRDDVKAIAREEAIKLLGLFFGRREDLTDDLAKSVLKLPNDLHETENRSSVSVGEADTSPVESFTDAALECLRAGGFLQDPHIAVSELLGLHTTSPSAGGCGDHSVGDGQVAEGVQPSATDTSGGAA